MKKNNWLKYIGIISWFKKPKIEKKEIGYNKFHWFPDGKINIAYNCLKKNIDSGNAEKTAIFFVNKKGKISKLSFKELEIVTQKVAYLLKKKLKNKKNPKIMLQASSSFESAAIMLACSMIGVCFSIIFEDLNYDAVIRRIILVKPDIFLSTSENINFRKYEKNFKENNLKTKLFLIKKNSKKKIKNLININKLKHLYKKYKPIKSNKPLFILFTSGSTGVPKGILHSYSGYFFYSVFTSIKQFGLNKNSIFLTASDAAWINGHTYALFSPLGVGATTILIEKPSIILKSNILEKIVLTCKPTILYLPVTLIRLLKSLNINLKFKHSISSLGSMGEPLASTVARWFSKNFMKKYVPIVNTYFQTETGGIIYSPKYNDKKVSYGTVGKPVCELIKINKNLKKKFEIKIKKPWPGLMLNVINGENEWNKYWDTNGNFNLFDIGSINKSNNLVIHGRSDDVINIRGKRLGSGEVESELLNLKEISEVCAIAVEDELEGNLLVIFYSTSKKYNFDIEDKIFNLLNNSFGSFALPKSIYKIAELPKTRSGKIVRRVLRDLYLKKDDKKLGDLSTMINKNCIKDILKKIKDEK